MCVESAQRHRRTAQCIALVEGRRVALHGSESGEYVHRTELWTAVARDFTEERRGGGTVSGPIPALLLHKLRQQSESEDPLRRDLRRARRGWGT